MSSLPSPDLQRCTVSVCKAGLSTATSLCLHCCKQLHWVIPTIIDSRPSLDCLYFSYIHTHIYLYIYYIFISHSSSSFLKTSHNSYKGPTTKMTSLLVTFANSVRVVLKSIVFPLDLNTIGRKKKWMLSQGSSECVRAEEKSRKWQDVKTLSGSCVLIEKLRWVSQWNALGWWSYRQELTERGKGYFQELGLWLPLL